MNPQDADRPHARIGHSFIHTLNALTDPPDAPYQHNELNLPAAVRQSMHSFFPVTTAAHHHDHKSDDQREALGALVPEGRRLPPEQAGSQHVHADSGAVVQQQRRAPVI